MPPILPIMLEVKNASHCTVLKHPDHWNKIWDILSYKSTFRVGKWIRKEHVSAFKKRGGVFGLGLYRFVIEELKKQNVPFRANLSKISPTELEVIPEISFDGFTPEDYQAKSIKVLDRGIKRGIFEAPTAAGKTFYEASIIKKLGVPRTLIITPLQNIATQTVSSLERFLGRDIGLLGAGSKTLHKVSVSLYQTLRNVNLEALNRYVDLILVDECHLAPEAINEILEQFPDVWYRFGLTGTPIPKYQHKEWFIVTGQLGEVISKTTEKEAAKRVVNDVEVYMFYFKWKPQHKTYQTIHRYDVLRNEKRCQVLLDMVKFGFDNGRKNCLLLVDEYEQAEMIHELASEHPVGKYKPVVAWSKADNEQIKKDFIKGKIKFCISTPVFSVGTDIPNIEHVCLGSARKSRSNLKQKLGRGRRITEGKDSLLVTDIYDDIANDGYFFQEYSNSRMYFYKLKKWYKGMFKYNIFTRKWILDNEDKTRCRKA